MSLYAWKYESDGTVVYTLSEEPLSGDSIYKGNGVAYEEAELHILYNGSVDATLLSPTVSDYYYLYPDTDAPAIKVIILVSGISRPVPIVFTRYSSGDIFPISKLKHNGITYEIVDEKARTDIENKQDALPSQSGNSGKFLTTNGTTISWANVDALPSQSGQSGKYLTTNGTSTSWETVDALPDQTSQSGKFLTTNGTSASWATIDTLPSQSGQSGKYLTTNGTTVSWATVAGPKFLSFTNVTADDWVSDSTYTGYSYKCVLTCNGVTSSDYAQVIFGPAQSVSGDYANVCLTGTNSVTIYSKVNTAVSIPTIIIFGSN